MFKLKGSKVNFFFIFFLILTLYDVTSILEMTCCKVIKFDTKFGLSDLFEIKLKFNNPLKLN